MFPLLGSLQRKHLIGVSCRIIESGAHTVAGGDTSSVEISRNFLANENYERDVSQFENEE